MVMTDLTGRATPHPQLVPSSKPCCFRADCTAVRCEADSCRMLQGKARCKAFASVKPKIWRAHAGHRGNLSIHKRINKRIQEMLQITVTRTWWIILLSK